MTVELSGDYKALNRDNIYDYILKNTNSTIRNYIRLLQLTDYKMT